LVLTVDRQVDPGTVDVIMLVGPVKEHNRTLVPALVSSLDISKFYRGSFNQLHATLERCVDVRRKPVELNKDRYLQFNLFIYSSLFTIIVEICTQELSQLWVGHFCSKIMYAK